LTASTEGPVLHWLHKLYKRRDRTSSKVVSWLP